MSVACIRPGLAWVPHGHFWRGLAGHPTCGRERTQLG